jgi:TolB-like protein/Tfp pilus assembly protein PilF
MRIRFADFELDLTNCELLKNGRPVALERRPTELLCHLAAAPNTLITRDALARQIWGAASGIDADMGINTAIRKIRATLGETPAAPRFIETIQGRGYRFIAAIHPEPTAAALNTIAVLPFDNLTGSDQYLYIADGFTEEMIAALGLIEPGRIQVIGRRSVMMFRDTALPLADIGAQLGAPHLLESAIRAEGPMLRATTKLIHAPTQTQLWTGAYNGPSEGLLAFQQQVSLAVCEQIRTRFTPESAPRRHTRHTSNNAAFDLYLRGRASWNRNVSTTNQEALDYFTQATTLDPGYALAWSGLADTYSASPVNADVPAAAIWRQARHAAEQAVRTGPHLAEAHASLGFVRFWLDWDWPAAEQDFCRAIALDPNYAFAHRMRAIALSHLGSNDAQAALSIARAVELDPLLAMHHALSAMVAFQAGDIARAVAFGRAATAMDANFWIGHFHLAQALEQSGQTEAALQTLAEASQKCGQSSKPMMLQGYILARSGRTQAARAHLATLTEMAASRFVPPYAAALIHAGLDDANAAFAALEQAVSVRDVNLAFLPRDPKWRHFHADPRFAAILAQCGFSAPPTASLQMPFISSPWSPQAAPP